MAKVEFGATLSQRDSHNSLVFITPIFDPRGGYNIEVMQQNPNTTLTQRLKIDRTRYEVTLTGPQEDTEQFDSNKTLVWSRTIRHARNEGLKNILWQKIANKTHRTNKS